MRWRSTPGWVVVGVWDRPSDPGWSRVMLTAWVVRIDAGGAAAHLRLHLAADRGCPNRPHASLEEVRGAAQAAQRVGPKARSGSPRRVGSRSAAGSVTSVPVVPPATCSSHG